MTIVDIPGGFGPGKKLIITGILKSADCSINLLEHHHHHNPFESVAMHVALRPHEHCVLFNSTHNGNWDSEERDHLSAIQPGVPFVIKISWKHHGFKVKVDKADKHVFNHRHSHLHHIDKLFIGGDCHIAKILVVTLAH